MKAAIKTGAIVLLAVAGLGLGGCVYYPVRPGVAYTDNEIVDYNDAAVYYRPAYYGYYSSPYWYGPGWYGYGPSVSLGFYGGYWGGHGYYGPWRGGYHGGYRGGWSGGRSSSTVRSTVPLSRGARH